MCTSTVAGHPVSSGVLFFVADAVFASLLVLDWVARLVEKMVGGRVSFLVCCRLLRFFSVSCVSVWSAVGGFQKPWLVVSRASLPCVCAQR